MTTTTPPGDFWRGRRVLLTGHTGFKGSWLSLWLSGHGAHVTGLALPPDTTPSLFDLARIGELVDSRIGDICDPDVVTAAMQAAVPEIVFHLAAQPLVRRSYAEPVLTFATNVMGTAHVLEAARRSSTVRAIVVVTTDKCYENRESGQHYREQDALGGHDPYSASKACTELLTAAWRTSFLSARGVAVATARAGNVIGGGDWAADRLVPDVLRAVERGEQLHLRNPDATRPWQHVLEPLAGYLSLAEHLVTSREEFEGAWNFGPAIDDVRPVRAVVNGLLQRLRPGLAWRLDAQPHVHEAQQLSLDSTKARAHLRWAPRWSFEETLDVVAHWHREYARGGDARDITRRQIMDYEARPSHGAPRYAS